MPKHKAPKSQESGNAVVFALIALLVVAVGAGAYFNMDKMKPTEKGAAQEMAQTASTQEANTKTAAATQTDKEGAAKKEPLKINQGNPVVAKIGKRDIKRTDVLAYIQKLPPNMQQLPPEQLFAMATEQVVNAELIGAKAKKANLDNDPAVKAQLKVTKDQIIRAVFVQKEVKKNITDERLKGAYEAYKKNFPKVDEVKARHILVKEESLAKDIIKQLKDGGDFAALAKEHSLDGTKDNGGELNYFSEKDVVPEFATAAFALKAGELTSKPVKSQFGYHVIKAEEKRQRPVPSFEAAKPFLAAQLQNVVLEGILKKWRTAEKVEIFDINGNDIEPAAGE